MLLNRAVFLLQNPKDLDDLGVTIGVTCGEVVTPLSAVRSCRRAVPPRGP
jgi:hypothetical protein